MLSIISTLGSYTEILDAIIFLLPIVVENEIEDWLMSNHG
jgi:hypothetical protein